MKEKTIKFAVNTFWTAIFLMIVIIFVPLKIKYILSPISITLFGLSLVVLILNHLEKLKIKDSDYFRNVLIGVISGLSVWILTTTDFTFSKGFWLGINDILSKVGLGAVVLIIGYKFIGGKK